jgi:hypothetical protein
MLSFEVSVIDVVLILVVMVLLILQITKQSKRSVVEPELSEPKLSVLEEKVVEKPLEAFETQKPMEEAQVQTNPQTSSTEGCPQYFGYLKKLPKDAPIPDECFRCPRMTDCFCK